MIAFLRVVGRSAAMIAGLLMLANGAARAATLVALEPARVWQPTEFRLQGGPTAKNPFDPAEIRVDATFVDPARQAVTVPAFWYQDFRRELREGKEVLTPVGTPEWRVRYTPTRPGEYHLSVHAARGADPAAEQLVAEMHFQVTPAPRPGISGWVRVAGDHRSLMTSEGHAVRLIGENVCWALDRGTFDYDAWFASMQRSGQNFARLWMAPWWAPLEHVPGTLTNYRLDAAWELDRVFQSAEQHGIYLMLCFDHHGMYSVGSPNWGGSNNFWATNPYNTVNGGPCATPNDFFANPRAREIYEKRIRYLIGRYGSSPNLLAWQLLNEIDNVYGSLKAADVAAWHRDVGQWLHAHDPFGHIVTTSLTGGSDRPDIWQLPEMDVSIYHSYADTAPARYLATLTASFERRYRKPVLIDEFGTSAAGWDIAGDPFLRGLREGLWGGAVGGSTGTAMPWWWEDIHAANAYPLWASLAKILTTAGWREGEWAPIAFATAGEPPKDVGELLPNGKEFEVDLPLGTSWRGGGTNAFAVTDPAEATRSGEQLNAYLRAVKQETYRGPFRLSAWFGDHAKVVAHVNSVAGDVTLIVRVDGKEIARTPLPDRDGRQRVNNEYNQDFGYEIPSGRHTVELENTGKDWVYFDTIRLQHVRPATLPGGWQYEPEPIGVHNGSRAVLYVVSPWVVYPAGAKTPELPLLSGRSIQLQDWPAGEYRAEWYNPQTGGRVGTTDATSASGHLVLPLPDFDEDLAAIVTPRIR